MIFECRAITHDGTFKMFVSADSEQVAIARAQRRFAKRFIKIGIPSGMVRLELYRADDLEEYVIELVEEAFDRAKHDSASHRTATNTSPPTKDEDQP